MGVLTLCLCACLPASPPVLTSSLTQLGCCETFFSMRISRSDVSGKPSCFSLCRITFFSATMVPVDRSTARYT